MGVIVIGIFAVTLTACADRPPSYGVDYRAPAKPMKVKISPRLERLNYLMNGDKQNDSGQVSNPDEFASQGGISEDEQSEPSTQIQLIGVTGQRSFEVRAFRAKVNDPMPRRIHSDDIIRGAEKDLEKNDSKWSKRLLRSQGTRPPLSFAVELADLESYQTGGGRKSPISSYWISGNPLFGVDGIRQDRTWQSSYLRQPIQLSRGQQYILSVVYESTQICRMDGFLRDREECYTDNTTFAQIPITID